MIAFLAHIVRSCGSSFVYFHCFRNTGMTRGCVTSRRWFCLMAECVKPFDSVYHSLESILSFLKSPKYLEINEVQRLLEIFEQNYDQDAAKSMEHLHPFIVFEGLDGSGKTTTIKKLMKKISARQMSTPPECLMVLRTWFDVQPAQLRRAYYSLGNYIVGQSVEKTLQAGPVLMDRFWNSTAAYAIADEVRDKNIPLPPAGDPLYQWPSDLTKPDKVLFLDVCEKIRLNRHSGRNTTNTNEEQQLANEAAYRQK
ncbi:hypothetical protein C0J52_18824 [Blattella germanica]|nr:hypothetical protein C0J52_18824 [Blattella germanica]